MTLGLEVFVQDVMAAMSTLPLPIFGVGRFVRRTRQVARGVGRRAVGGHLGDVLRGPFLQVTPCRSGVG